MCKAGRIIVIESGTDGSGKQTQTALLAERLKKEGHDVRVLSHPNYDSPSSELVKMYLSGKFGGSAESVDPYTASTFYSVDRFAGYLSDWKSFYESGGIVLMDRYTSSNMIYQGAKLKGKERKAYFEWLHDLEHVKCGLPEPDLLLLLDVPPNVSKELREDRPLKTGEERDIHEENEKFMEASYQTAKEAAEKFNWKIIECTKMVAMKSIEEIHEVIYKAAAMELG